MFYIELIFIVLNKRNGNFAHKEKELVRFKQSIRISRSPVQDKDKQRI